MSGFWDCVKLLFINEVPDSYKGNPPRISPALGRLPGPRLGLGSPPNKMTNTNKGK